MESTIGESAGKVWQALSAKGPMTSLALTKATKLSGQQINQAVGWLAREGKVAADKRGKFERLKLK